MSACSANIFILQNPNSRIFSFCDHYIPVHEALALLTTLQSQGPRLLKRLDCWFDGSKTKSGDQHTRILNNVMALKSGDQPAHATVRWLIWQFYPLLLPLPMLLLLLNTSYSAISLGHQKSKRLCWHSSISVSILNSLKYKKNLISFKSWSPHHVSS